MSKEKFMHEAEEWIGLHTQISVSAVGMHTKNGIVVLSGRIKVGPIDRDYRGELNSGIFWARRFAVDAGTDDIKKIVKLALDGKMQIMGKETPLLQPSNGDYSVSLDVTYRNRYFKDSIAPRTFFYQAKGGSIHSSLSEEWGISDPAWYLRALDTPYSDLEELFNHFGVPIIQNESLIELIVSPPAHFDSEIKIARDTAKINVNLVRNALLSNVKIGFIAKGDDIGEQRGVIATDEVIWEAAPGKHIGKIEKVSGDAPFIDLFLSYSGKITHCVRLHNRERHKFEPRALYSAFDTNFEALSELILNCRRSQKDAFEDAISLLFHMLGFSVAHYGGISSLAETLPDIISMTGSGKVAVIECTLGLPDQGDQVAKVLQRTEIVKKSLLKQGWEDFKVLPVVVTNLPVSELTTHRDDAEAKGVSVICREGLEELIASLFEPVDPDNTMNKITQRASHPLFRRGDRL